MIKKLRIGGACLNQTPIDWENNYSNIELAINSAINDGVELLCLPELCITGYGCEDLFLSQWITEVAKGQLLKIKKLTNGIAVCVGLPVIFENKIYNCSCLLSDGEILGFYAKQRLANDGVHYEPRWFTAWESGRVTEINIDGCIYPIGHTTFLLNGYRVGFEICEDAWQEDRPISYIHKHVDIVLNPSASHFAFKKAAYREKIVVESSRKYECIYLYTNLLGNEAGRMIYDGDILIASHGTLIGRNKRLSFENYRLLALDLEEDTAVKPIVKQDFCSQNEEFSHAAALALFDYLRKSRSKGFILSLSGGADSSCLATLVSLSIRYALEQLGKDGFEKKLGFELVSADEKEITQQIFTTAYQATINSSGKTLASAKHLAESIGATFYHWNIDAQVTSSIKIIEYAIGRALTWEEDDITLQNIQARSRSPIIWMLANLNNALLLATSNRSEGDVGYSTMDGDTSGSISPIAGIDKFFILNWLKYAEKELGFHGLKLVNDLTPTAELRPHNQHQTDEEDLMPYEALVKIEREAVLYGKSPEMILQSLSGTYDTQLLKSWINKFFLLWARNQWKRERYAPGFHFDDFNIDPRSWYRFPILSGGYKYELQNL